MASRNHWGQNKIYGNGIKMYNLEKQTDYLEEIETLLLKGMN